MTGPNLFDALSGGQNVQDLMMMQGISKSKSSGDNGFSNLLSNASNVNYSDVKKADFKALTNSENEAYKFDNNKNIKKSSNNPIKEKIDSSKDEINEFEKEIIKTVANDLDVSEEDAQRVLAELGLSVFDLLNPQNLAMLTVELDSSMESSMLILDADFNQLLNDISELGKNLMNELHMNPSEFSEMISMISEFENEDIELSDDLLKKIDSLSVDADTSIIIDEEGSVDNVSLNNQSDDSDFNEESYSGRESLGGELKRTELSKESEGKSNVEVVNFTNTVETLDNQMPIADSLQNYVSSNTMDIINQIAENVKVLYQNDSTTMEMQLNPENLGKVYVAVSSKEGSVNAQFTVTNEVVKEALEAQIVTLKENLNQAGVKVDAVEVTVASHEFERNLEQNHSREEQEGERQEESSNSRRSIRLDSLDELSGLMTEEESLVAAMMRDNGNSMDLQA